MPVELKLEVRLRILGAGKSGHRRLELLAARRANGDDRRAANVLRDPNRAFGHEPVSHNRLPPASRTQPF